MESIKSNNTAKKILPENSIKTVYCNEQDKTSSNDKSDKNILFIIYTIIIVQIN